MLEKLFFNTLNQNRGDDAIADAVLAVNGSKVRIPYLNGGLFEKDKLDAATVKFPAACFRDLFDTFERYNFTIDENDPDDKEVGVDPEMLGRIFENLLEDNKDKGAFYTPKEIVQYMCEESLIAYLGDTEANRNLVKKFDAECIENKAELIEKLEDVKICDPAIGSGAFPMGMLNILYRIRMKLDSLDDTAENIVRIKKEIIQNNIYGVDIEAGAVDIARLRFWLSIVVDEDKPIPLPNLDYKIMQGNSLLEQYNGVDLSQICNKFMVSESSANQKKKGKKKTADDNEASLLDLFDDTLCTPDIMHKAMDFYFAIQNHDVKAQYKERINGKVLNCITTALKQDSVEIDWNNAPFFLWHTFFWDVFNKKGGFDIVIGNPPYVSTKGRTEDENTALKAEYDFADDLYSHFIIQGFRLLKENGIQCQITSDTYFTTLTKQNVRETLLKNTFVQLVHWGHDIFDSAMVSTATFISRKQECDKDHTFSVWDVKGKKSFAEALPYSIQQKVFASSINGAFFVPNELNLILNDKFAEKHKRLLDKWWDKIETSKKIAKNEAILDEYREKLKPGDLTLLGLITDGGQGLATANNGKYVGVLPHTKAAENIRSSRIKKLAEFNKKYKTNYELPANELEIWNLFDSLKERYGRDCFGQGYIFRIVPEDMLADVSALTEDEKTNGITSCASFVPYDKGDKDGNRWYLETPYVIDWSRNNVSFLKNNSGKKGQGMPVVRNPKFYFKEGFCWNNNLNENYCDIKCRLKSCGVHDVASMSMFEIDKKIPAYFIVSVINSFLGGYIYRNFLNATVNVQLNDLRALPIIVPTDAQLKVCKQLFDEAIDLQKQYFSGVLNKEERDKKLQDIQDRIDDFVYNLYDINCTEYLNHSNSVFEKSVDSDGKKQKGKKAAAVPAEPVIDDVNDEDDGDF